jgi:hypothetical protein
MQTEKGQWGPDLENTVDGESIRFLIHAILPSFWLICDTVHCLDESALFFFKWGRFLLDFIV